MYDFTCYGSMSSDLLVMYPRSFSLSWIEYKTGRGYLHVILAYMYLIILVTYNNRKKQICLSSFIPFTNTAILC